ncbi:hypothetical protein HanPSC8_Chr01g0019161 [Helianthus annuus]|nr:hypothetical protein HanPSC8_Chr01g0019161 [Helianthus annuus]
MKQRRNQKICQVGDPSSGLMWDVKITHFVFALFYDLDVPLFY